MLQMEDLRAQMQRMEHRHQEERTTTAAQLAQQLAATNAMHEWLRSMVYTPPPPGTPPGLPS